MHTAMNLPRQDAAGSAADQDTSDLKRPAGEEMSGADDSSKGKKAAARQHARRDNTFILAMSPFVLSRYGPRHGAKVARSRGAAA